MENEHICFLFVSLSSFSSLGLFCLCFFLCACVCLCVCVCVLTLLLAPSRCPLCHRSHAPRGWAHHPPGSPSCCPWSQRAHTGRSCAPCCPAGRKWDVGWDFVFGGEDSCRHHAVDQISEFPMSGMNKSISSLFYQSSSNSLPKCICMELICYHMIMYWMDSCTTLHLLGKTLSCCSGEWYAVLLRCQTHHADGPEGQEAVAAIGVAPGIPARILSLLQDEHLPTEVCLLKGNKAREGGPPGTERAQVGWEQEREIRQDTGRVKEMMVP